VDEIPNEELWVAGTAGTLFVILEEALSRSKWERAYVAALLLRYGLVLHDAAEVDA
jgi:hypothetical protein